MTAPADAVTIRGLRFGYRPDQLVLDIADCRIARGRRVFVYGPSGSGKTTLLGLIAGVLHAAPGMVRVLEHDLGAVSGAARDRFRAVHVGYIFQLFNLIPYLSVLENITLPCRMSRERRARLDGTSPEQGALALAQDLGIGHLAHARVTELSVGQQQRVAAARALLGSPELIVADEPTSSLDADRRQDFLDVLFRACAARASTLVFVSHDRSLMTLFDDQLSLPDINVAGRSA